MSSRLDTGAAMLYQIVVSVWSQLSVAASVGLALEVTPEANDAQTPDDHASFLPQAIRSMDDYAGYLSRNGLGSLDIGGGSVRWGE